MKKLLKYSIFINALVTSVFYMVSLAFPDSHMPLILMWTSATVFTKYALPLYLVFSAIDTVLFNYLENK